jgi:hypothetical protein
MNRRATLIFLMLIGLLTGGQAQLEVGSPDGAFAGGPIKLSRNAVAMLRNHYHGDYVPLIPQPFRGKLDTALLLRDWPRVEALKKELITARGIEAVLMWEQSRFVATGGIGIAELHARDVAATGASGLQETAAMLWLYAAAVTFTDGRKCADPAVPDAHLDALHGPDFDAVTQIVRTLSDDRLAAMRDLAIRLELVLAPERTDDGICRVAGAVPDIRPDPVWRPEAADARAMLPKHLAALCAVMRPRPVTKP